MKDWQSVEEMQDRTGKAQASPEKGDLWCQWDLPG